MKSRVISRHKAEQISVAIAIKANEEHFKTLLAMHLALSDAVLPLHMEGMEVMKKADSRLVKCNAIKEFSMDEDRRMTYRRIARNILPFDFYYGGHSDVLDLFYERKDGESNYRHYDDDSISPEFIYAMPDLSFQTEHELYPIYADAAENTDALRKLFTTRVLAPIGGSHYEYLHSTPEFLAENVALIEQAAEIVKIEKDILNSNKSMLDDIKRNIARARTTKKICESWPEIAPFVARLYGEEEAAQEMETPLGNIIARHHPNLLGAPA